MAERASQEPPKSPPITSGRLAKTHRLWSPVQLAKSMFRALPFPDLSRSLPRPLRSDPSVFSFRMRRKRNSGNAEVPK
eukprot:12183139-Alexandrium_andersonii.AAC.1